MNLRLAIRKRLLCCWKASLALCETPNGRCTGICEVLIRLVCNSWICYYLVTWFESNSGTSCLQVPFCKVGLMFACIFGRHSGTCRWTTLYLKTKNNKKKYILPSVVICSTLQFMWMHFVVWFSISQTSSTARPLLSAFLSFLHVWQAVPPVAAVSPVPGDAWCSSSYWNAFKLFIANLTINGCYIIPTWLCNCVQFCLTGNTNHAFIDTYMQILIYLSLLRKDT